jgi:aspartyl protease family protein
MFRFDASSAFALTLAVGSSLSAAWWLNHLGDRGEAQAAPAMAPATGRPGQVLMGPDGHYWTEAVIEGRAVRMMVDTGASVVVLTRDDAARLGLRPGADAYTAVVQTASGPTPAAPVSLAHVSVGAARVDHVPALVIARGLPHSLLGMTYLSRLSGFEATPVGLTLRP